MASSSVLEEVPALEMDVVLSTGASEAMKNHMNDVLEFLADVHTLSKVKSNVKGMTIGLNEDTLGGILKASKDLNRT